RGRGGGGAVVHAIILEPTGAATDVMSRKAQELSKQAEEMQRGLQQAQNMDPKKRQEYAREQARLAAERTRALAETGTVVGGALMLALLGVLAWVVTLFLYYAIGLPLTIGA